VLSERAWGSLELPVESRSEAAGDYVRRRAAGLKMRRETPDTPGGLLAGFDTFRWAVQTFGSYFGAQLDAQPSVIHEASTAALGSTGRGRDLLLPWHLRPLDTTYRWYLDCLTIAASSDL
jgi:hypothetical protein